MRKLLSHKHAQMGMVGAALGLLITIIISVLVYYNIAASTYDSTTVVNAAQARTTKGQAINASRNATTNINNQASTFYTIAPIVAIVIVAVVVISYVQRIGG